MSSTAIERSLKNIRSELEFLRDEKFLRPEQYQEIANVLSTLPAQSNNTQSRPAAEAPEAKPSSKTVIAMYDWQGHEASDMSLRKGDEIEVIEELNNDWWRGKSNGNEGVFPANFVSNNPEFSGNQDRKQGEYIAPPTNFDEKQSYQTPSGNPPNYYGSQVQQGGYYGAPQQQQYQQPQGQQYYQPPQNQGQPPFVQQAEQPQQQQAEQHHGGGGHLKKFGSKFGNAAIFGAGATLGSDLINSIF